MCRINFDCQIKIKNAFHSSLKCKLSLITENKTGLGCQKQKVWLPSSWHVYNLGRSNSKTSTRFVAFVCTTLGDLMEGCRLADIWLATIYTHT